MKRILNICLVLAMCISMVYAVQPTAQAAENDLRDTVVAQTQAIMDVDWTLENRIYRTNVTGDRLEAFNAGGILPTTYFEFIRLHIPHKGVPVESNPGSLEYIKTQIDMDNSKIPGIGHITADSHVGMDVNSFLVDVLSRVMPDVPMTLKQALTHPGMAALMPEADVNASSSKLAIGEKRTEVRAAYG